MSASLGPKLNFATRHTDQSIDYSDLSSLLSTFQIEKLSYFFKFFDSNGDGLIDKEDVAALNERLRGVAGWSEDDPQYMSLVDENRVFFECLLDQVKAEKDTEGLEHRTWKEALAPSKMSVTCVGVSAWLNMWARLCKGAAGIDHFPIWVQLMPSVMFNIIVAEEGVSVISKSALRNFYEKFTGLEGEQLNKVTEEGFRTASANGDYDLDFDSYKLLFSNFLLGKTIYGPGKYIFGCFDNRDMEEVYKVVYDNAV
eukprot:GFUD01045737.1.p1 GENE.GFUD01045737.1~~GFUD01045737.1.p1  ORF type:complete len:255 (+),score=60.77 GFUD01045737.1:143-907(+)